MTRLIEVRGGMRFAVYLLLLLLLNACAAYPMVAARMDEREIDPVDMDLGAERWLWHHAESPRAVAVLTHGLNLNPGRMRALASVLQADGIDVLQLQLSGHEMGLDDQLRLARFRQADFSRWQQEMADSVALAAEHAALNGLPLYLVGFSLGGLLSVDHVNQHPDSAVQGMVLLAPALALRRTSYLLMPLGYLPDFYLPSFAANDYRANDFAPVSAYDALYQGLDIFLSTVEPAHIDIPTLLAIDAGDELVSSDGVSNFMARHQLWNWQWLPLVKSEGAARVLDHLIVDEQSLGADTWQYLQRRMLAFL
jgi:pimeloyl-ACP methyl ester carboxylesterase